MFSRIFNRRNFLLGSAATVAAASPLVNLLGRASVAAAAPTRALFLYFPDGCIPGRFHPTGSERGFTLNQMTSPLEPVKQHCVFLDGLSMFAGGATHEGGIRKVLTGTSEVSLDIFLGQRFAGQTPHNSLQLGVATNFENGSGGMSFIGREQEVKPDDDPLNAFSRVFGNVDGGGGGGSGDQDLAARRKKSVLDAALGDLGRLKAQYGAAEREKLETHTESVREVERRITANVGGGGVAAACEPGSFNAGGYSNSPNDFYPKTFHKEGNFQTVTRLQMDLAALALSCNATRVASLMMSHPVSPTHLLGIAPNHHDASHYGSADSTLGQQYIQYQKHFMGEVAYLIDKLEKTPDSDGNSLLYNTIIYVCSELGDGNNHDHRRMPFLLAGQAGGALETGRFLNYQNSYNGPFPSGEDTNDKNQPHSKLLVSIANMMGATDVDSFGYVGRGRGGLPGL
jgi:hypothetical protein